MADDCAFEYDAFLIYAPDDRPWVKSLYARLERDGLACWFDEEAILVGDSKLQAVEDGLRVSRVVILVLSPNSLASGWATQQWQVSLVRELDEEQRGRIIVLEYTRCEIPRLLTTFRPIRVPDVGEERAYRLLRAGLYRRRGDDGAPLDEKLSLQVCRELLEQLPPDGFDAIASQWGVSLQDLPPQVMPGTARAEALLGLLRHQGPDALSDLGRTLESLEKSDLEARSYRQPGGPSDFRHEDEVHAHLRGLSPATHMSSRQRAAASSSDGAHLFALLALDLTYPPMEGREGLAIPEPLDNRLKCFAEETSGSGSGTAVRAYGEMQRLAEERGLIRNNAISSSPLRIGAAALAMVQWFRQEPATGEMLIRWHLDHLEHLMPDQLAVFGRILSWWPPARLLVDDWFRRAAATDPRELSLKNGAAHLYQLALLEGLLRDIGHIPRPPPDMDAACVCFAYAAGLEAHLSEVLLLLGESGFEVYTRHLERLSGDPRRRLLLQFHWTWQSQQSTPVRGEALSLALRASLPGASAEVMEKLRESPAALRDWLDLISPPLLVGWVQVLLELFPRFSDVYSRELLSRAGSLLASQIDLVGVWKQLDRHRRSWIETLPTRDLTRTSVRGLIAHLEAEPLADARARRDLAILRRRLALASHT